MRLRPQLAKPYLLATCLLAVALLGAAIAIIAASQDRAGERAGGVTIAQTSGPLPWPRYVISMATFSGQEVMDFARDAGAQAVRVIVAWDAIEPENVAPDRYKFERLDAKFAAIARAGLLPQIVIAGCPAWACTNPIGPLDKAPPSEFVQLVTAIATRYSVAPYQAHFWEFWDEPDSSGGGASPYGWSQYGADYAALLAAAPAIRRIDPLATIANGGVAYDWFTTDTPTGPFVHSFLPDFLQAGGGAYIDYLAFHWEPANIHWPSIAAKYAELAALVRKSGFTKPLVSAETALTSDSDPRWGTPQWGPNSEAIQARYIVRQFAANVALGLPGLTWFIVRDFGSGDAWSAFAASGLSTRKGVPKPSFYAYRALTREIGQGALIRAAGAEFGGAVSGYLFAGAQQPVWVLWSASAAPAQLTLPRAQVVRVLDMLGQVLAPAGVSSLQLTLSEDPLFVEARSVQPLDVIAAARTPTTTAPAPPSDCSTAPKAA